MLVSHCRRRGAALLTVTLVSAVVMLLTGSLLQYAASEARLNRVNLVRAETQYAVEGVLEHGAAELARRFSANRTFNTTTLVTAPVTTHRTRATPLFTAAADSPTPIDPASVRLHVANNSAPVLRRIDPADPSNQFDPLRGQTVRSSYLRLLATATANDPILGAVPAYARQVVEIRDAALFNYAIFYNIPMEFHPGPGMDVWGPVHANSDAYITSGYRVNYYSSFTTAGKILAKTISRNRPTGLDLSFTNGADSDGDGRPDLTSLANHSFSHTKLDEAGNPTVSTTTTYVDSTLNERLSTDFGSADVPYDFATQATQLWRGNVQDSSLGVQPQNPPGVLNPADARQIILPPDLSATADAGIENQKFSRQVGLYILVDRRTDTSSGTPVVVPRVTIFYNPVTAAAFKADADRAAWLTAYSDFVLTPPPGLITTTRRMRDNREGRVVNMIDIDLGVLRQALLSSSASECLTSVAGIYRRGWNGGVYVEIERPDLGFATTSDIPVAAGADPAKVHGAGAGTGTRTAVRLLNARLLPSLAPDTDNPTRERGFSLVTNAPIYIAGHYNANGIFTTAGVEDGSERFPDPGYQNGTPSNLNDDTEVPAMVAADSINILSAAWLDASGLPVGDGRENNLSAGNRVAVDTEVSTAFMGGIVPTPANGNGYSGGVENYPRFHEAWAPRTLRYRGSIVALFNSAFALGAWNGGVYNAPTRRWGFHSFFANGEFPPLTPLLRTFRRVGYRDLSRAEYEAELADTSAGYRRMEPL